MKVRLLIGANAYAVIEHETGKLDQLLQPGRSPARSLRESAAELRGEANRKLRQASLLEEAAIHLESPS